MKYEVKLNVGIDDVLNVWARRWASHRDCRGYPSLQPFMREGQNNPTRYALDELDDETYMRIDEAVAMLHDLHLEAYQVLMAVFLQRQEKKEICQTLQIAWTTYDNRLRTGRDFMQGAVFGSGLIKVKF